jgi:hypothetical protein
MSTLRIDQMSREEKRAIQRDMIRIGFLDPVLPNGDPADDGIWGPVTIAAYASYWASRPVEISVPVVSPAPAIPWWMTRRAIGSIVAVAGLAAQFAGYRIDTDATTDMIVNGVELLGEVLTYVGVLVAWWGGLKAKSPIDQTLVARLGGRDVRLPQRLHG